MRIARELIDELIAHARADAPNECCGMIAARDGEALRVYPVENIHASPLRFEMEAMEQMRVVNEIEDGGAEVGGIYHSHTRSEPFPSQTDVNLARNWPDPLWVIVGLAGEAPEVRAFAIRDGRSDEVALDIT